LQKRLAGGLSCPQAAHAALSDLPQLLQNLAPAGLSEPQAEHTMARLPSQRIG